MSSMISIHYALCEAKTDDKTGGTALLFEPVTSDEDSRLEAAIQAVDADKRVDSVAMVEEQNRVLHQHVMSVPFDLPIHGYSIALDSPKDSLWNRELRAWIRVVTGGAIYFAVDTPTDSGRLFLSVWTEGATGTEDKVMVMT